MRRTELQGKYDKVRSSEDDFQEPNPGDDHNESYEGERGDGHPVDDDATSSFLAPSAIMDSDEGFGARGGAPRHYGRTHSRFGGADTGDRSTRAYSGRRYGTKKCWMLGILGTTVAVAVVSWVGSSRDGASNQLLQLRYPTTSQSKKALVTVDPDDDELISSPRPHLHELISDFNKGVTGNVSWLLDFAIVGHAKCATTSHLRWLRTHPEILMPEHEVGALVRRRPAEMVSLLYALPNRPHRKRGYKCPADIAQPHALGSLRRYWPGTKLIVGVRHPVRWFESYYNFNKRQADRGRPGAQHLGPAETLGVPSHVHFHAHLSLLGKTNVTDPGEAALLQGANTRPVPPPRMNNRVFLYESTQPYDFHHGRNARYRRDLETFLGLTAPLEPIPLVGETHGETYNYTSNTFHYGIDICEEKYADLRRQLVEVGTAAAEWILTYFVSLPDVTVSSPERFEELLLSWSLDPCEGE